MKEEYTSPVFNFLSEGVFVLDGESRIKKFNKPIMNLFNISEDSTIGKRFSSIFGNSLQYSDKIENFNKGGNSQETIVEILKPTNLQLISPSFIQKYCKFEVSSSMEEYCKYFRLKITYLKERDEFIITVIEVSDMVEYLDKLEENKKNQMFRNISSGIVHDINNLLMGVGGNLELASFDIMDCLKNPVDRNLIHNNAQDIHKYILDAHEILGEIGVYIQQFFSFTSKSDTMGSEKIKIKDIIMKSVNFALSGSNISPNFIFSEGIWDIQFNLNQFYQIFYNLAIMSAQMMPIGGEILVSAKNHHLNCVNKYNLKDGAYILIKITDQGIGIHDNELEHIFDPLFESTMISDFSNFSAVKTILKENGGDIVVSSTLNKGTTSSIIIPAIPPAESIPLHENTFIIPKPATMLIMDDDPSILKVNTGIFSQFGLKIKSVANGDEFLNLFENLESKNEPIKLILLDFTIRGGRGIKEIKENLDKIQHNHPEILFMLMSGFREKDLQFDYYANGFTEFIQKPFLFKQINEIMFQHANFFK